MDFVCLPGAAAPALRRSALLGLALQLLLLLSPRALLRALHTHIPYWNKRRRLPHGYQPQPSIPKRKAKTEATFATSVRNDATSTAFGAHSAAPMNKEDDVYYRTETARVNAELVRPLRWEATPRGRTLLLWAFLLRAKQTLLYIHACTASYCLHMRSSCRFFFPWEEQQDQQ